MSKRIAFSISPRASLRVRQGNIFTVASFVAAAFLVNAAGCASSAPTTPESDTAAEQSQPEALPENAAAAELVIEGEWRQGSLVRGHVTPGSEVEFMGKKVRVAPSGDFIIGLGRDAEPEVVLGVRGPGGEAVEHHFTVAKREYQIQRIEGVQQKHVTPPASVTARIRAEAEQVYLARQMQGDNLDFLQRFQWPVAGPITGVYGSQRVYNGVPRSPHYGVDIAAARGTPVVAPASGIITLTHDDMYYSGGTLILDHGYGLSSTFIHLHKILVEPGQRVEQGEVIAEVGSTGRSTGPHLDWRMNWYDARIDPQQLMTAQGQSEPLVGAD